MKGYRKKYGQIKKTVFVLTRCWLYIVYVCRVNCEKDMTTDYSCNSLLHAQVNLRQCITGSFGLSLN